MAPNNETPKKDGDNKTSKDAASPSSSSWFGSWFERDMRNEIHEQLNDFDDRKKEYEAAQREHHQRWFGQSSSSFPPFPFFVPPHGEAHHPDDEHDRRRRHAEDLEEFLRGKTVRPRWHEDDGNPSPTKNHPFFGEPTRDRPGHPGDMDDLHRELQNMFEAAFAGGGFLPPPGASSNQNGGWTSSSSSSTTVVSNSHGTSYTLKQDSKNGARVDLRLPEHCPSETVAVEVLEESPCVFRWRSDYQKLGSNSSSNGNGSSHRHKLAHHPSQRDRRRTASRGQVLEFGTSVDCSRLSATVSEARHTLTVRAPPKGENPTHEGGGQATTVDSPRAVPVRPTR